MAKRASLIPRFARQLSSYLPSPNDIGRRVSTGSQHDEALSAIYKASDFVEPEGLQMFYYPDAMRGLKEQSDAYNFRRPYREQRLDESFEAKQRIRDIAEAEDYNFFPDDIDPTDISLTGRVSQMLRDPSIHGGKKTPEIPHKQGGMSDRAVSESVSQADATSRLGREYRGVGSDSSPYAYNRKAGKDLTKELEGMSQVEWDLHHRNQKRLSNLYKHRMRELVANNPDEYWRVTNLDMMEELLGVSAGSRFDALDAIPKEMHRNWFHKLLREGDLEIQGQPLIDAKNHIAKVTDTDQLTKEYFVQILDRILPATKLADEVVRLIEDLPPGQLAEIDEDMFRNLLKEQRVADDATIDHAVDVYEQFISSFDRPETAS